MAPHSGTATRSEELAALDTKRGGRVQLAPRAPLCRLTQQSTEEPQNKGGQPARTGCRQVGGSRARVGHHTRHWYPAGAQPAVQLQPEQDVGEFGLRIELGWPVRPLAGEVVEVNGSVAIRQRADR